MVGRSVAHVRPFDIKKEHRALYGPRPGRLELVDVPALKFLMVEGHGDPNTSPAYREAVEALYTGSYAVRAAATLQLERVHTVGPLEGLWHADDLSAFRSRDKSSWDWTLMIAQPDWITADLVDEALHVARTRRRSAALDRLRFENYPEGLSVQTLHVGSYDDEGPTLARLHEEFLPANGLHPTGRHHEVYLSDPRKTVPARLRTILRQPVGR